MQVSADSGIPIIELKAGDSVETPCVVRDQRKAMGHGSCRRRDISISDELILLQEGFQVQ